MPKMSNASYSEPAKVMIWCRYATTVYDESDNLFAIGDGHLHCLQPYLFHNQIEYYEVRTLTQVLTQVQQFRKTFVGLHSSITLVHLSHSIRVMLLLINFEILTKQFSFHLKSTVQLIEFWSVGGCVPIC